MKHVILVYLCVVKTDKKFEYFNCKNKIKYCNRIKQKLKSRLTKKKLFLNKQKISYDKVRLSGYGVDLHLKSTEYKSQDDSPRQNENKTKFDDTVVVEGFDFGSLK